MKFRIVRKCVEVTHEDILRMQACLRRGRSIFNPDEKRLQAAVRKSDPLCAKIAQRLRRLRLLKTRRVSSVVALHSKVGCQRQNWHYDYDPDALRGRRVKPLGMILALEDGTKFETLKGTQYLSRGDILLFDGDLIHAGAAYDEAPNTRVHAYIDTKDVKRAPNRTYLATDVQEWNKETFGHDA